MDEKSAAPLTEQSERLERAPISLGVPLASPLPGHFVGRSGTDLLSIRDGVEEALASLLDDDRPLTIGGGETASLAQAAGYRIADLGGYLLAARRGASRRAVARRSRPGRPQRPVRALPRRERLRVSRCVTRERRRPSTAPARRAPSPGRAA
jgi:hypothetical protein